MKGVFARHGIPEIVRSDNGPQYSSHEFASFADSYGFQHLTSSPYFAQSNGQAERMVQTVKRLLLNCSDPFMALLTYRATPLAWCGLSPAELSMGRQIRTTVPQPLKYLLVPTWGNLPEFRKNYAKYKEKQKSHFDQRHRVWEAFDIPNNTDVWVRSGQEPVRGTVTRQTDEPRSYVVNTSSGDIRRNRSHLSMMPPPSEQATQQSPQVTTSPQRSPIRTRSHTGTATKQPEYLRFWEREMWNNVL